MTGLVRAALRRAKGFCGAIGLGAVIFGGGLAGTLVTAGGASADDAIGSRVASLIGQERAALSSVSPDRVRQLIRRHGEGVLYDDTFLQALPAASGSENWRCLATALYFEARGESIEGQFAVAEVILNRVDSPAYPDTICNVVYQGARAARANGGGCQFSFACDGRPETIRERRAYDRVAKIARLMKDGAPRVLTQGATHFHTRAVNPRWSRQFPRTAEIGGHLFYREPGVLLARN